MRMLILAHAYWAFLQYVYGAHPNPDALSYAEQFALLDRESHIFANAAWVEALAPFGYDVSVAVANDAHSQRTWAREHGIPFLRTWKADVAAAQVAAYRPELLFFTSYQGLDPAWIEHLRSRHPSIRLVGIWCGMPFTGSDVFRQTDVILTCIPESVERFAALGCRARHLHHGFDHRVLDHITLDVVPDIACSFIGQLLEATNYHRQRIALLERIARHVDIEIFTAAYREHLAPAPMTWHGGVRRFVRSLAGTIGLVSPPRRLRLPSCLRPPVFGLEFYRTIQRTRVSFNSHIDFSPLSASNRRLFEVTGVGSCLLTDQRQNLPTLFEPDREVVTFSSADECAEKVCWLLEHPSECLAIAKAGQRRTLAEHTYVHRAEWFHAIMQDVLAACSTRLKPGR